MKINSNKSNELVTCFTPDANVGNYIPSIVIDGSLVETVEYAKLLRITLSSDLTWNRHVECIVKKKGCQRVYMLFQLKRADISQLDMVRVYTSVVRPVLEYACPVWHINLPKYLSDSIELIQSRALKSTFPGKSYNDILNGIGLRTLRERREVLCMKYFTEIQGSAHILNY